MNLDEIPELDGFGPGRDIGRLPTKAGWVAGVGITEAMLDDGPKWYVALEVWVAGASSTSTILLDASDTAAVAALAAAVART